MRLIMRSVAYVSVCVCPVRAVTVDSLELYRNFILGNANTSSKHLGHVRVS